MRYQLIVSTGLCVVMSMPAVVSAQTPRVEVSGIFGWTISDGLEGDGIRAGDGNVYNAIDIKDSLSWGFGIGFNVSETAEVGFLFNQQMSTLGVQGTAEREIGDLAVTSYHPYYAYNFLTGNDAVRPFVLFGLGATTYASVRIHPHQRPERRNGRRHAVLGHHRRRREVLRVAARRTARVGRMDADLHHIGKRRSVVRSVLGCYAVGDAKYANQFHLNGGITFRFETTLSRGSLQHGGSRSWGCRNVAGCRMATRYLISLEPHAFSDGGQSCRTTLKRELSIFTFRAPS